MPECEVTGSVSMIPARVLMLLEHGAASHWWERSIPLLRATGVEVVVVTVFERGPIHANLEEAGCGSVLTLGCRSSRDYPRATWRLARLIREREIDIVHANETIPATISGIAGVLARRGTRIFHRHHNIIDARQQVFFSRIGSRLAHLTMAVSKSAAHHAETIDGVAPRNIRVAYNGVHQLREVSMGEAAALRERLGIPANAPVILVVARLYKEKGQRTLLEALPHLTQALPQPPHVVLVGGSGPEELSLKARAQTLGPAIVHFVGHQLDVAPWYAIADVVAVPSLQESFSLSAVEAMTCRRPVVASRLGGLMEVVEGGVSGILVEPRNPRALADAVLLLLQTPELAARITEVAYQRFRALFTMETMVASWRTVYDEVMAARVAQE